MGYVATFFFFFTIGEAKMNETGRHIDSYKNSIFPDQ